MNIIEKWECPIEFDSMSHDAMAVRECGHHFSKRGILKHLEKHKVFFSDIPKELKKNLKKNEVLCPSCNSRITQISVDHEFRQMIQDMEKIAKGKIISENEKDEKNPENEMVLEKPNKTQEKPKLKEKEIDKEEKMEIDEIPAPIVKMSAEDVEKLMIQRKEINIQFLKIQRGLKECSTRSIISGSEYNDPDGWKVARKEYLDLIDQKKIALSKLESVTEEIEKQTGFTYFVFAEVPRTSVDFELNDCFIRDSFLHLRITAQKCESPYMYLSLLPQGNDSIFGGHLVIIPSDDSTKKIQQEFKVNVENLYILCKCYKIDLKEIKILQNNTVKGSVKISELPKEHIDFGTYWYS